MLVCVCGACNNHCSVCLGLPTETQVLEGRAYQSPALGRLVLVGGEPTLWPGLPLWIERHKEQGMVRVTLETNGRRLAYPAFARRLQQTGVDDIHVLLWGATAPLHDFHTGVLGSFVETVTGLRQALAAGCSLRVTTLITRANYRHQKSQVYFLGALGVRQWRVIRPQPLPLAFLESAPEKRQVSLEARQVALRVDPGLFLPYFDEALDAAARLGIEVSVRDARQNGFCHG